MKKNPDHIQDLCKHECFKRLMALIIVETGLVYFLDKESDLADRVQRRMLQLNISNLSEYFSLLVHSQNGLTEWGSLVQELTIGETYFFRHREQFDALRDEVIPKLIKKNLNSRKIRIWCAGCSIGAEPYSMAILLRQSFATALAGWDVRILATDINLEYLERARKGIYEDWSFRSTSPEFRTSFFSLEGKSWRILPEIQKAVSFQFHNLQKEVAPLSGDQAEGFDLIVCRNVLIYFDRPTFEKTVQSFGAALCPDGWLVLGHSEHLPLQFGGLKAVQMPVVVFYQRAQKKLDSFLTPQREVAPLPTISRLVANQEFIPPEKKSDLQTLHEIVNTGNTKSARELCRELLKKDRFNPILYFYQGLVAENLGFFEEAEKSFRQAVYLNRSYALGHYYLGLLLQSQGQIDLAKRSFRNAMGLFLKLDSSHCYREADGISVRTLLEEVNN